MAILDRLYTLLTVCSVFGYHKTFLLSLFGGHILMDFVTCLEHLSQDYDLGYGIFLFGSFKVVSEILFLFLLLALGLKSFYSPCFSWGFVHFLCDLRGKSGKLKNGFYSKKFPDWNFALNDIVEESTEKANSHPVSDRKINRGFYEEHDFDNNNGHVKEYTEEDDESDSLYIVDGEDDDESQTEEDSEGDVSALRKLIKIERRRANAAVAELVKERAASATAAEEAMAMILRLQNEKSSIEMESSQYRRLAEEKQIHDQQVIQSLQWVVWKNESEISLLQEELKLCRRKLNRLLKSDEMYKLEEEEVDEAPRCGYKYDEDVLENVLYSSLDFNFSPK